MCLKIKNLDKKYLMEIVQDSSSYNEVIQKIGCENKGNVKKNLEYFLKKNNISIEHFTDIKMKKHFKDRYNKIRLIELCSKYNVLKDILFELGLTPITSNYRKLKEKIIEYGIQFDYRKDYNVYEREELLKLVDECNTFGEMLVKTNRVRKGGNLKTLKKYLNKYNIDYSKISNFKYKKPTKRNLDEVLVKDSSYYNTSNLKERLYNEGVKSRKCEMCGQGEIWNGEKISLILDHINGINNDNRLENLRIVCPNCNATLPTHCGKNLKTKIKDLKLKKESERKNNNGRTIKEIENSIKRRKVERPEYGVLLNEIDELGYAATGRKYGVSDNTIRKWVKFYENNKKW
jgi:hypothetical protein